VCTVCVCVCVCVCECVCVCVCVLSKEGGGVPLTAVMTFLAQASTTRLVQLSQRSH
jgi:hypothetical protein